MSLVDEYDKTLADSGTSALGRRGADERAGCRQDQRENLALALDSAIKADQTMGTVNALKRAYLAAQKVDYDADLVIEPDREGFVDLVDLATHIASEFPANPVHSSALQLQTAALGTVLKESHRSGRAWLATNEWNLNGLHGLSIYLPLGEDIEMPFAASGNDPAQTVKLREVYTCAELKWVCDTQWDAVIKGYYAKVKPPVAQFGGPMPGLLPPDITPPRTTVGLAEPLHKGQPVKVIWNSTDLGPDGQTSQTGVLTARLWVKQPNTDWMDTGLVSGGTSGLFSWLVTEDCGTKLSVMATDKAGNTEKLRTSNNTLSANFVACVDLFLPLGLR